MRKLSARGVDTVFANNHLRCFRALYLRRGYSTNDMVITLAARICSARFCGQSCCMAASTLKKNRLLSCFCMQGIFLISTWRASIFGELDPNRDWFLLWTVRNDDVRAFVHLRFDAFLCFWDSTFCSAIAPSQWKMREGRKARMVPRVVEAAKPVNNVRGRLYPLRIGA